METTDSFARQNILVVASELIREKGSQELDVVDVAQRAKVDISLIEYFFDSRTQLVAEAQMSNYFELIKPHHLVLARVETAVAEEDQVGYWAALDESMILSWSSGQVNDKWGIVTLLHDVWSDPFSQSHFCELLDVQFERWVAVIDAGKSLGWIDGQVDAKALIAVVWSASVGQVITAGSTFMGLPPASIRDFYTAMLRGHYSQG